MIDTLREFLDEERAVSPVIGVILMVAITVILAAVIGTFVLDIGSDTANEAPQASLTVSVDAPTDDVIIEHTGGDGIDARNTRVLIENTSSGDTVQWNSTSSQILSVGDSGTLGTETGATAAGAWSQMTLSSSESTEFAFDSGVQIKITIIDTDSQRQIFQTTVTA